MKAYHRAVIMSALESLFFFFYPAFEFIPSNCSEGLRTNLCMRATAGVTLMSHNVYFAWFNHQIVNLTMRFKA